MLGVDLTQIHGLGPSLALKLVSECGRDLKAWPRARVAPRRQPLGEKGEWNLDELKIEFEELSVADAPIEVSGFSLDEIDHIVLGEVDAIAVARIGDVFDLGPHRIVCGSTTEPETLRRLMEGDPSARLVLTDEPSNVPIAGHVTGGRHREFAMASGEMTDAEFLAFQ